MRRSKIYASFYTSRMSSSTDVFFSERNEAMLQRVLYNDVCRRTGTDLNEKQATRLIKTVKHYMGEIHRVNGSKPVSDLNKEVLRIVLPDYIMYLDRKERSDGRSVASLSEEVSSTEVIEITETIPEGRRLQMDVGTAFSKLQSSRQETKSRPPIQDFRLSLQDEPPVSMDNFERMKQEREEEAARVSLLQQQAQAKGQAEGQRAEGQRAQGQGGQQRFADATDVFSRGSKRAMEEAEAAFAERERKALESRAAASQVFTTTAPPDMRALFMGDRQTLDRTRNNPNMAAGNPTVVQDSRTTSQQMLITREQETMAYKENELNLFIYSGDRDWVSNSLETRYNFTVNFDPSNMPVGLRLSPTSTAKFRNIVRVEFVKAIMPGEGLDMIVSKSGAAAYDSSVNVNLLSFPYIQVRIPELDTNNYGTNQGLNSAFGVLQYDGNWISDTSVATQRGYLAMIPKFMKCQKTYTPTPLATIQKLSFQFQRPDGTLLSTVADTLDIGQIFPTLAVNATNFTAGVVGGALPNTSYVTDGAVDVGSSAYYWLKTTKFFNRWTVSKGDKIVVKNMAWANQPTGNALTQITDFLSYIQQDGGLLVVDTGYITGTDTGTYRFNSGGTNSYNAQGYANAILVRGKFVDPTIAGGLLPATLGGIADTYVSGNLSHFLANNALLTGRLLNQSHQVQLAMRVITREVDSTGILRPDNL